MFELPGELREATQLTDTEFNNFLNEIEKIPSPKAPINGKVARLCFEFMEDTGCRINETIHVRKKDIDFHTRILTVTMPKSEKRCKCSKWRYKDQYSRQKILDYADPSCDKCHGKGKWKQPQTTTITARLLGDLSEYCNQLEENQLLFPAPRQRLYKWGKMAGKKAGINIFQQQTEKKIEGIFLHLFRALCSLRMLREATDYPYKDQLIARKLRHSFRFVTDRYTKIDIHELLKWERSVYG